jgi:NADPH-dependent curcumin reductase CurA
MISQYNDADNPPGVKTLWQLVVNRLKMQGFITYDYADRLEEAQSELDQWVLEGKLKPLANVRDGFEKLPEAFIDLMEGRTVGKTIVRI